MKKKIRPNLRELKKIPKRFFFSKRKKEEKERKISQLRLRKIYEVCSGLKRKLNFVLRQMKIVLIICYSEFQVINRKFLQLDKNFYYKKNAEG